MFHCVAWWVVQKVVGGGAQVEVLEEIGPFGLHRLIGRGGAGQVWEATDRRTARKVALKLLAPEVARDEEVRTRFLREAKLAARLEDPHAVPIYDYGDIDGQMYLSMKYVDGPNLAQLAGSGRLPAHRVVRIVGQVASALAAAHEQGFVHRDVKPSNILLTTDHAGRDFAYLADFGIMRSVAGDTTSLTAGLVIGTVDYMAPEQFSGRADARSDIYALGGVLFACLAGQVPFPQDTFEAKLTAKLWGAPPKLSDVAPWVGDHLDAIVRKALAKDPNQRYKTVTQFAAAAQDAVDSRDFGLKEPRTRFVWPWQHAEPNASFTPTANYRAVTVSYEAKRRARMAGIAMATAVVLLLGVGALVFATGQRSEAAPPGSDAPAPPPTKTAPVSTALPRWHADLVVPGKPETVAVSPDGAQAYMTTSVAGAPAVHVIDTAANRVTASIPLPGIPRFVVVNPATGDPYVTYNDLAGNRLAVAEVNPRTNQITRTLPTGQPVDRKTGQTWLFVATISRDGTRMYVPHHDRSAVSVIDLITGQPVAQIGMPLNPHSIALTPDGATAFVAAHMSGEVDEIDVRSNQFLRSIPIGSGMSPHDVAISPDGTRAQVVDFDGGKVSVIDTATGRVVATVPVGGNPQSVVFAPDGRRSYVIDNKTNTLHTIDAVTNTITGSVQVAPGASMIALSPDGTRAYVSSRDSSRITTFLTAA